MDTPWGRSYSGAYQHTYKPRLLAPWHFPPLRTAQNSIIYSQQQRQTTTVQATLAHKCNGCVTWRAERTINSQGDSKKEKRHATFCVGVPDSGAGYTYKNHVNFFLVLNAIFFCPEIYTILVCKLFLIPTLGRSVPVFFIFIFCYILRLMGKK